MSVIKSKFSPPSGTVSFFIMIVPLPVLVKKQEIVSASLKVTSTKPFSRSIPSQSVGVSQIHEIFVKSKPA